MSRITISKEEFDSMAERIRLPIVKSTYEDTCTSVEAWLNNAAAFNERFINDEKYRDTFLCVTVRR